MKSTAFVYCLAVTLDESLCSSESQFACLENGVDSSCSSYLSELLGE